MLWKKGGPSPNPGGRPALFAEVRQAAQEQGLASIKKLVDIRDDPKAPLIVQLAAANSLLDRGYGRAPQAIAIKDFTPLPDPKTITKQMTYEEAAQIYADTMKATEQDLNRRLLEPPVINVPNEDDDAS
jgi:2,4-dienoyl-CoA reductase-like NADH-dependent reductase (Old Yellow Enzyme family)